VSAVDLETELALAQDEDAARTAATHAGATLESSATGIYWLTMRAPDGERYVARIAWTRYPDHAPSVKFAPEVDGPLDQTSAWPLIPGYRAGNYDICQPFTAEGQAVHSEWGTGPEAWPATGNCLLWVVEQLLHDITDRYQGRSG